MEFTREYVDLCKGEVTGLRRDILLWHVSRAWGCKPCTRFPIFPIDTRHPLTLPCRHDPAPTTDEVTTRHLLTLHQLYGPTVVDLNRVIPHEFSEDIPTEVVENVAYTSRARVLLDYDQVWYRVHTGVVNARYKPAWEYTSVFTPFSKPDQCRDRLDAICHGCLVGMDWNGVAVAGGAAAACLTPEEYITTQEARDAYDAMDVDLFVFTPDALVMTLEHFRNKFNAYFGVNRGVVVVCIRNIPRVFQVIPVQEDPVELITRFDLDFAQVIMTDTKIFLTPLCIRAHATRVCRVNPHILPGRQHKARRKGFGLDVRGMDVVDERTRWDMDGVFIQGDTDEQVRFNMLLNLRCNHVSHSVETILEIVHTTDLRNGPDYVQRITTPHKYTAAAYLECDATITDLFHALPTTLPHAGVLGCTLPFTLVFPTYMWGYDASCESLILQDTNHVAPGRLDLLRFSHHIQLLMNVVYGDNECVYPFDEKERLPMNVIPSTRILDVHARTVVEKHQMSDACVCTSIRCSSLVVGHDWWSPVFVCGDIDVFPPEMRW